MGRQLNTSNDDKSTLDATSMNMDLMLEIWGTTVMLKTDTLLNDLPPPTKQMLLFHGNNLHRLHFLMPNVVQFEYI